jgi:hypothetical protein
VIVGDFNTHIINRQVIKTKKRKKRNISINRHNKPNGLKRYYRVFHSTPTQYAFFSATHGTFSKRDHILGNKSSINKLKKINPLHHKFLEKKNKLNPN